LDQAIELGVIDEATFADLMHADFVIVSVPVDVALTVVPSSFEAIGEQTIVFEGGYKITFVKELPIIPKGEIL
jgi:prephenate dehydrogenase